MSICCLSKNHEMTIKLSQSFRDFYRGRMFKFIWQDEHFPCSTYTDEVWKKYLKKKMRTYPTWSIWEALAARRLRVEGERGRDTVCKRSCMTANCTHVGLLQQVVMTNVIGQAHKQCRGSWCVMPNISCWLEAVSVFVGLIVVVGRIHMQCFPLAKICNAILRLLSKPYMFVKNEFVTSADSY